ncbi:hypothetical protein RJT34_13532 [Clitoria ternatea]|uniref:Glabrous enhancer-binding protein-like DBD domain-containing protein n=1 Tax=Clitoria ternatea TaxID=43366 RepID=A0AAN9JQT3_CLITE
MLDVRVRPRQAHRRSLFTVVLFVVSSFQPHVPNFRTFHHRSLTRLKPKTLIPNSMAQKQKQRPSPLDDPPTASSSSESEEEEQRRHPSSQQRHADSEEDAYSEEEGSSEEEDEQQQQPPSKNPPPPPTNSHPKPSSSDSATESDSGSDSEHTHPTNSKVKPLNSKPMEQAQKSKTQPSSAQPKSGSKRAPENNAHVSDPKRAKKKATESSSAAAALTPAGGGSDDEMEEDEKKSGENSKKLFQRLWSEEDELAIIKGVADFASKTGQDPLKYASAFHDFIKKSLHVEASSNQLKEKLRRLKKKFEINAGKGKNGEAPKFSKPHEQKAFELSKKAWGGEQGGGGGGANGAVEKAKSNGKAAASTAAKSPKKEAISSRNAGSAKKSKSESKPDSELVSLDLKESGKMDIDHVPEGERSLLLTEVFRYQKGEGVCGVNEDEMKKGLELMAESKKAELEGKWRKLRFAELELFSKRAILAGEQTKLILEALESSKH